MEGAQKEKGCKPNVTIVQDNNANKFPRTVAIDFGDTGCEGEFGKMRKGKIIVRQTKKMTEQGALRTITLENFEIDGFKIEGTRKLGSKGKNDQGNYEFTASLTGGKITTPGDKEITREMTRQKEWIKGSETPRLIRRHEWKITGSAEGVNRKGKTYTSEITSPLILDLSCRYKLVQGEIKITTDNREIVINYGTGACDNKATTTIDGNENEISL